MQACSAGYINFEILAQHCAGIFVEKLWKGARSRWPAKRTSRLLSKKNMDEVLKYAVENGMLDLSYVQEQMEMEKRKELLKKHPWAISQGKDGKWRTYIPCDCGKRKMIKRNKKESVEDEVVEYWRREMEDPTVRDLYNEWVGGKLKREEITYATKNRYDRQFEESMGEFAKARIKKIEPYEVEEFLLNAIHEHSLTQKGFSNLRTLVYGVFKMAKKKGFWKYSISEVVKDMEIPRKSFRKEQKKDDELIFMEEEIPRIMSCIHSNEDIINLGIFLLFKTGLRPGELAGLKWEDVEGNILHIRRTEIRYDTEDRKNVYEVRDFPKTEAGIRDVIIPDRYVWILSRIGEINPSGKYVFEKEGKRIKTYQFRKRMESLCRKAGVQRKSLNKIRKTYGTILIDENVDDSLVIAQMGHTDILTTKNHYYKNRKNLEQKENAINRIRGL